MCTVAEHSLNDDINRATDVMIGWRRALVCRYCDVGKGCTIALTIPSARIPGPVKLEPPLGSCPSPSGYVWAWLRHVGGVTVAHRPFNGCAQLNTPPQVCACCFPVHIGSVPGTFSSTESSNSSARARSFPRYISFRVTKNGARVFIADRDLIFALQAYVEGLQAAAIEIVVSRSTWLAWRA